MDGVDRLQRRLTGCTDRLGTPTLSNGKVYITLKNIGNTDDTISNATLVVGANTYAAVIAKPPYDNR